MKYGLHHNKQASLDQEPSPIINFNTTVDWQTMGDLHGNALYLLHFLIQHGLARFKTDAFLTKEEIKELEVPAEMPRTFYQYFREMYHKPVSFWTKDNIHLVEKIFDALEIAEQAHIRLLGDMLCDRGQNDYFTLLMLRKIIRSTTSHFQIILSNHDMEFICRHEKGGDDPYSELNALRLMNNVYLQATGQTKSLLNMNELIHRGIVPRETIADIVSEVKASLHSLSYDSYEKHVNRKIMLYSHAPINEIDVLRAALSLIEPHNSLWVGDSLAADDSRCLNNLYESLFSKTYDTAFTNDDLVDCIDILNRFTDKLAEIKSLSSLLKITSKIEYGSGYSSELNKSPFDLLIWNRVDPKERKNGCIIRSLCVYTNVHGHSEGYFDACLCLDQPFGKPEHNERGYSIHISRSAESPMDAPSLISWSTIIPAAVFFLGVVSLLIARVCTGEIGAFFSLGACQIMGTTIKGLPHVGVGIATAFSYLCSRPASQDSDASPVLGYQPRPPYWKVLLGSCF